MGTETKIVPLAKRVLQELMYLDLSSDAVRENQTASGMPHHAASCGGAEQMRRLLQQDLLAQSFRFGGADTENEFWVLGYGNEIPGRAMENRT